MKTMEGMNRPQQLPEQQRMIEQQREAVQNKIEALFEQSPRLAELKEGIVNASHTYAAAVLERNAL